MNHYPINGVCNLFGGGPLPGALRLPELPLLREGDFGTFQLRKVPHPPPILRGYFCGLSPLEDELWTLSEDGIVWMSNTPMEYESNAPLLLAARGHVLIVGLGLGMLLHSVKCKPTVKSITVVEQAQAVIDIHEHTGLLDGVDVQCQDIFTWDNHRHFDTCLVDIWQKMGDDAIETDLTRIAKRVNAKEFAAWTLELCYVDWCKAAYIDPSAISEDSTFDLFEQAFGVPLFRWDGQADAARQAAENVVNM